MPSSDLTDFILALLRRVDGPRHRRCGPCGGQCHRHPAPTPTAPPESLTTPPHTRVLEQPPSPSPDWVAYQPMEPLDLDASPWGHRDRPCAIHGWGPCPNRVALAHGPSSSGQQGEAEGEEEDEARQISVRISIGPRG
jgi:hypothetical protein